MNSQEELDAILELVKTNQKGQYQDEAGNICWYLDDLIRVIQANYTPNESKKPSEEDLLPIAEEPSEDDSSILPRNAGATHDSTTLAVFSDSHNSIIPDTLDDNRQPYQWFTTYTGEKIRLCSSCPQFAQSISASRPSWEITQCNQCAEYRKILQGTHNE